MKIALCLSGQARFAEQGYHEVILPFILKNNDIDVFIHTWDVDTTQVNEQFVNGGGFKLGPSIKNTHIQDMLNLYNPIKHKIEPQIKFERYKWADRTMPGIRSDFLYSMFYSIYQANELKLKHEIENNFVYDWVIRSRFDIKLNSPIDFQNFDSSFCNIPSGCFNTEKGYVDSFAFANSYIMNLYSSTYLYIDNFMNDISLELCGEYILRKWLDFNQVQVKSEIWHGLYR